MTQCQISRKRSPGVIPCFYSRTNKRRRDSEVYWRGVKYEYTAGIRSWLGDCWERVSPVKCWICCSGMSYLVTLEVLLQIVYLSLQGPINNLFMYTPSDKNPLAWNFPSPVLEVTWRTVAIIIRVVLLSPYLRIRGVSVSSIHYNQSHRVYINRRQQYFCLIWN